MNLETEPRRDAVDYMVNTAVDSEHRRFEKIVKGAALAMMQFFYVGGDNPDSKGGSCIFDLDLKTGKLTSLRC